jgi:hypothetical protein
MDLCRGYIGPMPDLKKKKRIKIKKKLYYILLLL